LKLAFLEEAEGKVVNIGYDKEIRILELAKLVKMIRRYKEKGKGV